ncbi:alpha/beta hydrolase [Streptomyces sp. NBRC 109706]|uniref:alpha/beta hydrolase n=1 Tax=Streptomyces sp. NBRC 109706 TaxID=1550035 RepID=UPI000781664D|nr:alpha/beta fold hydrolase [Streptomyces sp. NBRC 109706]
MPTSSTPFPVRNQWDPSAEARARTAVVVLPGRGETTRSYRRLGARLAYDTLAVTVLEPTADEADIPGVAEQIAAGVAAAGHDHLVLVGHDAGANLALRLADPLGERLTALVLSSPGRRALPAPVDWAAELELRAGCPGYTGQLDADPGVSRGTLVDPPAVAPPDDPSALAAIQAPVLLLTGDQDPIPDRELLRRLRTRLPRVTSVEVRGGRRDVLNDRTSRSVSGEIVRFVEWARSGDLEGPLLRHLAPTPFTTAPPADPPTTG